MAAAELATARTAAEAVPPACGDAWDAAPFNAATAEALRAIVTRLAPTERAWLCGYLAGTLAAAPVPAEAAPPAAAVTILYGSQSGNAERLARELAQALAQRHSTARLLDMLDCRKQDLENATTLLVIVSTHGDGEPPERAQPLHELLHGRRAPRLAQLRYSVLALGDSSYEQFCATGRQFDARLELLGARRLEARVDCDVDFAAPAAAWIAAVAAKAAATPGVAAVPQAPAVAAVRDAPTRARPFAAPVLANQRLTARGSSKDVRHLELSLAGSNIRYEPGDALGIVPRNRAADADAVLAAARLPGDAVVARDGRSLALRDALLERCEIATVSAAFLRRYAAAVGDDALTALVAREAELARYARGRDLRDMLTDYPPRGLDAERFAALLPPLAPRLYSLASSPAAVEDEAHLTIGIVEYEALGRQRRGVVSDFVASLAEDDAAPVYLHRNTAFRLPPDPATAIVMIGAGTGIAPFRAFVAEREAVGATGRNWLFFGDRSFELDFLYQADWLRWRKSGALARLDVAFSRDQPHKVYVQQRIRERGVELWSWLEAGACIYVCGDAARLAPDVDAALHEVVRVHGGRDEDGADDYWLELKRARRYQRDVY